MAPSDARDVSEGNRETAGYVAVTDPADLVRGVHQEQETMLERYASYQGLSLNRMYRDLDPDAVDNRDALRSLVRESDRYDVVLCVEPAVMRVAAIEMVQARTDLVWVRHRVRSMDTPGLRTVRT